MMLQLAYKVIQCYEDFDGFVNWLKMHEKLGTLKSVEVDKKSRTVSIGGMVNTGFVIGHIDPINLLVILGFAFYGPFWPFMTDAKEAFKMVREWWRNQVKKKRGGGGDGKG